MNFVFWYYELEEINAVSYCSKQIIFIFQLHRFCWYIVTFFSQWKDSPKGNVVCLGYPKMKERCAVFKVVFLKPCALKHSEYLHFHYLSGEAKVAVKSPVVFVHLVQVNFVHLLSFLVFPCISPLLHVFPIYSICNPCCWKICKTKSLTHWVPWVSAMFWEKVWPDW